MTVVTGEDYGPDLRLARQGVHSFGQPLPHLLIEGIATSRIAERDDSQALLDPHMNAIDEFQLRRSRYWFGHAIRSMIVTLAMPPPSHIVCRP